MLLRPWRRGDERALVRHADNRKIWRNLRDRFPHPYTWRDAVEWIRHVEEQGEPTLSFAIVLGGEPVGGIGFERFTDVEQRVAEIGYWLSEEHWGKGVATEAVAAATTYAFETFEIVGCMPGCSSGTRLPAASSRKPAISSRRDCGEACSRTARRSTGCCTFDSASGRVVGATTKTGGVSK